MTEQRVFKATSIKSEVEISVEELIAKLCYYYPQYTYKEASQLPYFRLIQLLNTASKEKAQEYFELTRIVAAPHIKGGHEVKKLLDSYSKIIRR